MAASTHDNPDVSIEKPRPTLEELKERKRKSRQPVGGCRETITVSMGPQHPSTHGVFRAELDLDGEIIVNARPEIGNLHRGVEKLAEYRTYHQFIPVTDRLDYISSFAMNHAYCEAVEKLMGVEVPPRARYIRTLAHELTRIANHLLWLGVHVMDLGAQTFFLITFRDREYILDLFEMLCGARLTHSYARIGGVSKDLPEDFDRRCREVVDFMPKRLALKKNVMSDAASMVQDFVHVFHGARIPEGEVYSAVEVPKGEMGVYISSDGGPKPQRLHLATPTFYHCQAVPPLFEGETLADSVGIFGSVDVVLGDSDR